MIFVAVSPIAGSASVTWAVRAVRTSVSSSMVSLLHRGGRRQRGTQRFDPAGGLALDGAFGDAEQLSHFGDRKVFEETQHDHRALARRERGENPLQVDAFVAVVTGRRCLLRRG